MLETATRDAQLRQIYECAHLRRANTFRAGVQWLRPFLRGPLHDESGASPVRLPRECDCPA